MRLDFAIVNDLSVRVCVCVCVDHKALQYSSISDFWTHFDGCR